MSSHTQSGRDATETEIREAERVLSLTPVQQRGHPSAVPAYHTKLSHINTYCGLPEFLSRPAVHLPQMWQARDLEGLLGLFSLAWASRILANAQGCLGWRTLSRGGSLPMARYRAARRSAANLP